jgi:hypothetical protein
VCNAKAAAVVAGWAVVEVNPSAWLPGTLLVEDVLATVGFVEAVGAVVVVMGAGFGSQPCS